MGMDECVLMDPSLIFPLVFDILLDNFQTVFTHGWDKIAARRVSGEKAIEMQDEMGLKLIYFWEKDS